MRAPQTRVAALVLALFVVAASGLGCGSSSDGSADPRAAGFEAALAGVMAQYQTPGAVAGVWTPGRPVWRAARGVGDVEHGRPIRLDQRFGIRSITKSFTVTLILQLVREQALSLDDPIAAYVSGIPNGDLITLRQLANMTSGLVDYTQVQAFIDAFGADFARHWTAQELVAFAAAEPPKFSPGAQYNYCNTNTLLLGMVVEAVTRRRLGEEYAARILTPLRLSATSYPDRAGLPDPHPVPYEVDPHTGALEELPLVNLSALGAAGGMVTTLADLHVWGEALGSGRLVGAALLAQQMQSRPATDGPKYDEYGLGIGVLRGWWGHTGDALGFDAATFRDPQTRTVIAVLVNSSQPVLVNSSQPVNVATEIFEALAAEVAAGGLRAERKRSSPTARPRQARRLRARATSAR